MRDCSVHHVKRLLFFFAEDTFNNVKYSSRYLGKTGNYVTSVMFLVGGKYRRGENTEKILATKEYTLVNRCTKIRYISENSMMLVFWDDSFTEHKEKKVALNGK